MCHNGKTGTVPQCGWKIDQNNQTHHCELLECQANNGHTSISNNWEEASLSYISSLFDGKVLQPTVKLIWPSDGSEFVLKVMKKTATNMWTPTIHMFQCHFRGTSMIVMEFLNDSWCLLIIQVQIQILPLKSNIIFAQNELWIRINRRKFALQNNLQTSTCTSEQNSNDLRYALYTNKWKSYDKIRKKSQKEILDWKSTENPNLI